MITCVKKLQSSGTISSLTIPLCSASKLIKCKNTEIKQADKGKNMLKMIKKVSKKVNQK